MSKKRHPRRTAQPGIPRVTGSATVMAEAEKVIPRTLDENAGAFSREGIESIIIAILLALLFRAFEAEAFVIPTGSMAPTLQGRHNDVKCPECGERFRAGASADAELKWGPVVAVTCPTCRFPRAIDPRRANDSSFNGDRILVNKFAYQFGDPQRWDVIVFKYPGNAKQNYIKRLVGLPSESLRVRGGDVFIQSAGTDDFAIARKPPKVLLEMTQTVHDTEHIAPKMIDAGWPASWQAQNGDWTSSPDQRSYTVESGDETRWLHYRHLPPSARDWTSVARGELPPGTADRRGELISDFAAYNSFRHGNSVRQPGDQMMHRWNRGPRHWVSDLALECTAEVTSDTGQLLLTLIEGGRRYSCQFDIGTGQVTAQINGGQVPFAPQVSMAPDQLTAATAVRGPGTYRLRWSNVDDQLRLWVNGKPVAFSSDGRSHDGGYDSVLPRPTYSADDPGDLHPARIGCQNASVTVSSLKILRDIYYVAMDFNGTQEYALGPGVGPPRLRDLAGLFRTPEAWSQSPLFGFASIGTPPSQRRGRNYVEFELGADQFFPMGDNSPQSQDARLWSGGTESLLVPPEPGRRFGLVRPGPFVHRDRLIGKAFLIYWPHGWYPGIKTPFPFIPNVARMGRIH